MAMMKKYAIMAIIGLLFVPAVVASVNVTSVVGDTVFIDISGVEPDLAAIAGLAQYNVVWFNDALLYQRAIDQGEKAIYAVAAGAPDPTGQTLTQTATKLPTPATSHETNNGEFTYTDPNNESWVTKEYTYTVGATTYYCYKVVMGAYANDAFPGADVHTFYNFVVMVNTDATHLNNLGVDLYIGAV
ncbi:MAG: hypothetical protein CVT47_01405 [Thermoplasmata archaeon HGW-Thermoplasmata-2]|nr:MAG: hypothetical protein CVT47_01405 [Thermoplasmata archaeon HGW-Thermoplasmata-2]